MSERTAAISSIIEELDYWRNIAGEQSKDSAARHSAESFGKFLTPLVKTQAALQTASPRNILDLLENADLQMTDLWKQKESTQNFPGNRMKQLFGIFEQAIIRILQEHLRSSNIWTKSFVEVEDCLTDCLTVCDKWREICRTLTAEIWTEYNKNPWKIEPVVPENLLRLQSRLKEIIAIRSTVEDVKNLLGILENPQPLDVFHDVNATDISSQNDAKWAGTVRRFEDRIERYENIIAENLQTKFHDTSSAPLHMIMAFRKCNSLIRRPNIKHALVAEREILLTHVANVITSYEQEHQRGDADIFENQSKTISSMIWMRQLGLKIQELSVGTEEALGDLPKFPTVHKRLKALQNDVQAKMQEAFDGWCDELLRATKDPKGELSLDISGRLMEIEQPSGRLVVNFSDRLVMLMKEVRWLESVGFRVPEAILDRANVAKKFYDSGVVLMQVAHFYNTIDQQMIHCQKPMMIASARQFENIIRSGKAQGGKGTPGASASDIKWSDLKRVETYVNDVHTATLALTQENRRLRSLHQKIISLVQQMFQTNLVQKLSEWKRLLNEIHKIMASVAVDSQRYPPENMSPWRLHIDHQVRKALEVQLRQCLISLGEQLPHQNIEIIYRANTLQLRPSVEEIRELFSKELGKLFDIPATLKPLSEANEKRKFFREIVSKCHIEVSIAQRNLEVLLQKLSSIVLESSEYVILGSIDIQAVIASRVTKLEDWDRELKALKHRGRLVEQIPLQITVENVNVNLAPVRTAVEGLLQDAQEALVNSLRKSIAADVQSASGFVKEANGILTSSASSPEELTTLSLEFVRLVRESEKMKSRLTEVDEKNTLLKSVAGKGVDKSEMMIHSWNNLLGMLEDHKEVMKSQTAGLQSRIKKDLAQMDSDIEKFDARWQLVRPSATSLDTLTVPQIGQIAETIRTRREELELLSQRKHELEAQCVQLEIKPVESNALTQVLADMKSSEESWSELLGFVQELDAFCKEDWIMFRNKLYKFEDFLKTWTVRILPAATTSFTLRIQKEIAQYRAALPSLKCSRGEMFSDEHWGQLFRILKLKNPNIERLLFGDLLSTANLLVTEAQAIKDLSGRAEAEISIREALRELEIWGATATFHQTTYQDSTGASINIITEWADLLTTVGAKQRLIQSTKDSQHYGNFSDRIVLWEHRLVDLSFLLDNLHQVQRRWVYLEPIFSRNTLANDEGRFKRANADILGLFNDISKDPRLTAWLRPTLKGLLPNILEQLQKSQRALNEFLEDKRLAFPRFYFIGDDDLLEILGQSGNPRVLQAHLKKLFAGIHSVEFNGDAKQIVAVKSPEGEVMTLKSPVNVAGSVEVWLLSLSEELKRTLKMRLKECLADSSEKNNVAIYPAQVLRLCERINFTKAVEQDVRTKGLENLNSKLQQKLATLTAQQHSTSDPVQLTTLKGLILDIIHRVDVISTLLEAKVTSTDDWIWQKQLRFYAENDSNVMVRMVDAEFKYSFEYQGCLPGLVHTPLTDKCFLTLTQAMQMGLGGNPYGPAGTGKTESVKELGANLGRQVLVFNCDEGIDPKSMGRIFIGLLKCGAWGCFDEFNRLDKLTLSAISMQILAIQAALKDSSQQLVLLERTVNINQDAGIFITLNPASKGYGGRQQLPDNLKQLFRPIAMAVPDVERIAEVLLLAEGFQDAAVLGKKLIAVYSSAKQLLSKQQHYDWGLRAIKSTIQMAGRLIGQRKETSPAVENDKKNESRLLLQALRSNVLSKLTAIDQKAFVELIRDVFPGMKHENSENGELQSNLISAFDELGLLRNDIQVKKAIELQDQLSQRMGVVLVGPSGSGKTTTWKLLQAALSKLNKPVVHRLINPTAMPKIQLLGYVDDTTREWTDGVLTKCVRDVLKDAEGTASWIICDGDIDPDWVESLNSVLDDNRLLTLPSGERLRFPENVNFLFETSDLKAASPATVSRMGMVFLSSDDVVLKTVVGSWIKQLPEERRETMLQYTDSILYKALAIPSLTTDCQDKVAVCISALSQLTQVSSHAQFTALVLQSIGGCLHANERGAFAKQDLHKGESKPDPVLYNTHPIFDCIVQQLAVLRLLPWMENKDSILLIGPNGCGKTTVLQRMLRTLGIRSTVCIQCTSVTSAQTIIAKLKHHCLSTPTANGRILRPKHSDRLVVYVKGIHLVKRDRWGHSQVDAFLRQLISQGGFFDTNSDWVRLDSVQIFATCSTAAQSGNERMSERLTSVMRLSYLEYPDTEDLQAICTCYLQCVIGGKTNGHTFWKQRTNQERLASSIVSIFTQAREKFTRENQPHYMFTLKGLVAWIMSLLRFEFSDQSGSLLLSIVSFVAERVIGDKLTSASERIQLNKIVTSALKKDFPSFSLERDLLFSTVTVQTSSGVIDGAPLPAFGKMLSKTSTLDIQLAVAAAVRQLNRENYTLEAFIHERLLDGIFKLDHWLSVPGGSVVLLAPSGYGRRTMVLIAAKMQQAVLMKPKIVKGYCMKHFQADLKRVLEVAAIKGENVIFLLEDYQIIDPVFLEMVTSVLGVGEYAGLYTDEETEKIHNLLVDQMSQEGFDGPPAAFFQSRTKQNFHCVVTMDSNGSYFPSLCDQIPALSDLCHIIWADSLPESILSTIPPMLAVAGSPSNDNKPVTAQPSSPLTAFITFVHQNSPETLQTSSRFYKLLETFHAIKDTTMSANSKKRGRLQAGIDYLTKARSDVMVLKQTVGEQHKALSNKQEEARRAMDEIRESMSGANTQKEEVILLKADLELEKTKLLEREQLIAQELQQVAPILEAARNAVTTIKAGDLSEIKSLRAPPTVIHNILEGVLKLFGNKDTSWSGMRAFLTPGIKEEIVHFDAGKVSREHLKLTQNILEKNRSSFEDETAKRASAAAAPLAAWVRACVKYAEVHEKIAPLANEKRKLESTIEMHAKRVFGADQDLGKLSTRIDLLQARFQQLTEEAAFMKIELNKVTEKLQVAEFLVEKLENEYSRWSSQLKESVGSLQSLEISALVAAGFVTYLASCSEDERELYLSKWTASFKIGPCNLLDLLTTDSQRQAWRTDGLSSDTLSLENAVIITHSTMQPLILDPTGAILEWLKRLLKDKSVEVADQEDNNFQSILEISIRFGKSLIIEVSEKIDPVLLPLLRRDLLKQGSRKQIEMGDKLVDYHPQFCLYLITRNPSLVLHPQMASVVNVVSFTATRAGLANQLLSLVIECKLPLVERRRRELLLEQETLKLKLTELEDTLLNELSSSQGNILENKDLRESLSKTKSSADTVEHNLAEARRVKETLDQDQAVFAVLATKCCSVYFALQTLPKLNPLYRFSLKTFVGLYRKAVEYLAKDDQVKDHLQKFCALAFYQVIHYVYNHVNRAIFKRDRLTLLLTMIKFVRPELIKEPEWQLLLGKQEKLLSNPTTTPLNTKFLDPAQQREMATLLNVVPGMRDGLQLDDLSAWKTFLAHPHCETSFPAAVKISPFQQLLVIQALRPDRIISALAVFAGKSLKLPDLATDTSLRAVFEDSSEDVPILIITSAGSDPSLELADLARERASSKTFQQLAVGLHEFDSAIQAMRETARSGGWLCLKNLHLVPTFFPHLLKELKDVKPNPAFRLWLTTEVTDAIPSILLESSLKCVHEAPPGIKQNILRSIKESSLSFKSGASSQQSLLILCWFHAIIQERRNYLPSGWTKFYEFNTSDFRTAVHVILKHGQRTANSSQIGEYICGLLQDVVYGGRVDLSADQRVLAYFVGGYFGTNSAEHQDLSGKFQPTVNSVTAFLSFVQTLPDIDEPEVLGLPANIDSSHQKSESKRILYDLHNLQKLDLLQMRTNQQSYEVFRGIFVSLQEVAKSVTTLLTKLITYESKETLVGGPMETFFQQELVFARDVIHSVLSDIENLSVKQKPVDGLSMDQLDIMRSLVAQETPKAWQLLWLGPSEPSAYISKIGVLAKSAAEWIQRAKKKIFTTVSINVQELFHPEMLFSVTGHFAARESSTALEQLEFCNEWSLTRLKSTPYAVLFSGLLLEGAMFDGRVLADCKYDAPTSSVAPKCYVAWVPKGQKKSTVEEMNSVNLPVFTDASRQLMAFHLSVPCNANPERWIRASAAFILNSEK